MFATTSSFNGGTFLCVDVDLSLGLYLDMNFLKTDLGDLLVLSLLFGDLLLRLRDFLTSYYTIVLK
jgi:hypothetical protein